MILLKLDWKWYVILILALYITILKSCNSKSSPGAVVVKHDTTVIKHTETVKEYVPQPITVSKNIYLQMQVDTAKIIEAYLSKVAYKDTVRNKYGYVIINDTITHNLIESRKVDFNFQVPQITLTSQAKVRNQIYAGLVAGGSKTFIGFGGQGVLRTKANNIYTVSASFTTLNSFYFQAGAAWLIHF